MKVLLSKFQKNAVIFILLTLFVIFSLAAKSFLSVDNLINMLVQSTVLGIVGFGLVVIMISGEIDLAFAGVVPLEGAIFATLLQNGVSIGLAMLATFATGIVVALVIVLLVTQLQLSSFVTTIALMFLLQGIWYVFTGGKNIFLEGALNRELLFGTVWGIPRVVIIFLIIFVLLYLIMEHTPFGLRLRAVGEDIESARTMGLNPNLYKTAAFIIGGLIFALGAYISTVRMSGAMATAGSNLLMPVMTVAFVGQTFWGLNRPNILGVFLAAMMLSMINNAFVLMQLPFWSVPMANGIILILAISLANIGKREIVQISM